MLGQRSPLRAGSSHEWIRPFSLSKTDKREADVNIAVVITGFFVIEATLIFGLLYIRSLLIPGSLDTDNEELDDRWSREYEHTIGRDWNG